MYGLVGWWVWESFQIVHKTVLAHCHWERAHSFPEVIEQGRECKRTAPGLQASRPFLPPALLLVGLAPPHL